MKYMLMMHAPKAGSDTGGIGTWPPQDVSAHIQFMMDLNKALAASGELVDAQGLALPSQAKLVRARKGAPPTTDGPFPETKEFLAGFWILSCATEDRAVEIAAKISAAPGRGGVPLNMPVELREVMIGPPPEAERAA